MHTTSTYAQTSVEESIKLYEEYEDFIKQNKKAHKLKGVIPYKDGDFLYFKTLGKNKKRGIMNKDGEVIIPT